ncbi:hypothetical protein P3T76_010129 [Phytophthora citrophthora]|uniref:Uncharacterized protein n=1 Tax=Phytophthora citrophthora TaxID=4793 RepID=A0AAD9GE12_9STRA|nr:hypothetical protein P3T76_010129 [Phytophthora citrophthora]
MPPLLTPVQLTYHRQDYRHALPILLIRRPGLLGGEFRVPLDPCIHPVRLLPVTMKMVVKREFALEYGWHTKQLRLRAPDANTYRRWTSLVTAALESGRRPLASCDLTPEEPKQDLECSSLASTMNSSNFGTSRFNATVRQRAEEEEEDVQQHFNDFGHGWQQPSDFFVLNYTDNYLESRISAQDVHHWSLSPCSSAAIGSCSYHESPEDFQPPKAKRNLWRSLRRRINLHIDWPAITHELYIQVSVFYFLL